MKNHTKGWLIADLLEQSRLLHVNLDYFSEKPTDLEVLLLKQPSPQKYVIYRCLWNSGFNPTKNDWVYHYIFLSTHIADKLKLDIKLTINLYFKK